MAARSLQAIGAIEYQRGRVVVLQRQLLEEAACECYGLVREYYSRVPGWPPEAPQEEAQNRPK